MKPWFELDCDQGDQDHPFAAGRTGKVTVWSALGSRSSVIFDLDDDGDLDIVTHDFNSRPQLLISDLSEKQQDTHFLKIQLQGTASNRDGLGAVVRVTVAEENVQSRLHDGQSGYLGQSSAPLYFGLGAATEVQQIDVTWPSGKTQTVSGPIDADQLVRIVEEEQ